MDPITAAVLLVIALVALALSRRDLDGLEDENHER